MRTYTIQDKEIQIYFDTLSDMRKEILSDEHNIVAISGFDCKENLLISFGAFVEWMTSNWCEHAIVFFPTVRRAWETLEEWASFYNHQMVKEKVTSKRKFRIGNTWFYVQSLRTSIPSELEEISGIYIYDIPRDSPANRKVASTYASIDQSTPHKVVDVRSLGWATYLIHDDIMAKKNLLILTSKFVNMDHPRYSHMFFRKIPPTKDLQESIHRARQEATKWKGYLVEDLQRVFCFECSTHTMYWGKHSQ